MKLVNVETKQYTAVEEKDSGWLDWEGAINRLVCRGSGHFAFSDWRQITRFLNVGYEFDVRVCRSVGNMTEHTGKRMSFRIED